MSRITVIGAAALALALGIHTRAAEQDKKTSAKAELLVVLAKEPPKGSLKFDYMASQVQILTSKSLIERAIAKGDLNRLLPSLRTKDSVPTLANAITVVRDKNPKNPSLTLKVSDLPGREGVAFLEALIGAYRDYVAQEYIDVGEQVITGLQTTEAGLEKRISEANREHQEFLKANPRIAVKKSGELSAEQQSYSKLTSELADNRSQHKVLKIDFEMFTDIAEDPAKAKSMMGHVRQWAQKKNMAEKDITIDGILASMRTDLRSLEKQGESLESSLRKLQETLRADWELDKRSALLLANVNRARSMLADTTRMLEQAQIGHAGLLIRVVTDPHVVD